MPTDVLKQDTLDRHLLAVEVFDAVYDGTESFEEQIVGADLAYLMYSILQGEDCVPEGNCEWPKDRPILKVLRKAFTARGHAVWKHVRMSR